uniref:Sex determination protein tasselseed-2 n=1 Tax=Anthurium amnicola TaxID=1678845 RepID=A0A1D1YS04_9ARAE
MLRLIVSRGRFTGSPVACYGSRAHFASMGGGRRLEGKVALITGGASGLGRATAHEFVQQGARVVVADIDAELGSRVAAELGPLASFVRCDVAVEQQVAEAVDFAVSTHGRLDVMHNNAGVPGRSSSAPAGIAELDLEEFDRVMGVNVRGAVAGIKHAARVMCPAGSGSILCTASVSGVMGGMGPHPYTISKSAIAGVVRSAASELCGKGVRVNCISPFVVATGMVVGQLQGFFPGLGREAIVDMVGKLGELKGARCEEGDVAKAAAFLASDDAKYVTGHNLVVDGGFTCFKRLNFPTPDRAAAP